ncbi:MAG: AAA family ATPase, partial [Lachnospiraceae bacterium]|nr:AAA family ATPase [Lachnospiraceae bacterium]
MDLFEYARAKNMDREAPLASRLRPSTLDEVVGQQHIIGKDKLLYRAIRADKLSSVIFYGPPGTGKTTLAKVIANTTSAEFTQINATIAGKKDMEAVVGQAKETLLLYQKRTILFVDEIHRFNKGQQDYLLPFVEDGTVILIGATTENPYFEVNGALISRSSIFELHP